jgi:hypothetical protein
LLADGLGESAKDLAIVKVEKVDSKQDGQRVAGLIPGLIHADLAGGVYVKSKEESTAGSSSAHAGDSNAATESAIAISCRGGRGSHELFPG